MAAWSTPTTTAPTGWSANSACRPMACTACPKPRPRKFCRCACSRSEEHTSELQSPCNLVCRLLLEKKKNSKQPPSPSPLRICSTLTALTYYVLITHVEWLRIGSAHAHHTYRHCAPLTAVSLHSASF